MFSFITGYFHIPANKILLKFKFIIVMESYLNFSLSNPSTFVDHHNKFMSEVDSFNQSFNYYNLQEIL